MDRKHIAISIGLLATIGVTGLAFQYRKEIIGLISGKKIVKTKAVSQAVKELDAFKKGSVKEHSLEIRDRVNDYWKSVGLTYDSMKNEAWSAAFISYIIQKSGAKNSFKYSPSHSEYIVWAINNKKNNKGSWKGYKPQEVKLEKGDLVCYARAGSNANYDTTGRYTSHCDIVHKIDKKQKKAFTIGGNVSDSVSETIVNIDENGKVKDSKYFVVIKNK